MRVFVTDALVIDLDAELWHCRACDAELGPARENYKWHLRVRSRDPREIHAPIIDADSYEFTFAPDPEWVRIVEYYCPGCARQVEAEYLPPGHPPAHDIHFDLDALKAQWAARELATEPSIGPEFVAPPHHHRKGGQ